MTDLIAFLNARLDEDEHVTQAACASDPEANQWHRWDSGFGGAVLDGNDEHVVYDEGTPSSAQAEHIARHDPARAVREATAIRAILGLFEMDFTAEGEPHPCGGYGEAYWDVLCLLSGTWSDHPEYDPAWATLIP